MSNALSFTPSMVGLLTDFGWSHYVGQMKAVLWHYSPTTNIIDISHSIPKQDVTYAAIELLYCLEAFPPNAWIIAVIDPEVGTRRPVLMAEIQGVRIVAPDNGLISLVCRKFPITRIISLTNREFWRNTVSPTFHGRDIMANAVGQAIRDPSVINQLGQPLEDYRKLDVPEPEVDGRKIRGNILYIDTFGNAITNVGRSLLLQTYGSTAMDPPAHGGNTMDEPTPALRFKIDGVSAHPEFVDVYASKTAGSFVALIGSSGYVEFALTNGNAARQIGLIRNQGFEVAI